jgi:hypothetical protein
MLAKVWNAFLFSPFLYMRLKKIDTVSLHFFLKNILIGEK